LSVQFQIPYWYRQIVWGRLDRYQSTGGIISKPTILSKEPVTVPGSLPEAELMLPEYLKGNMSLDEWQMLIALNRARLKVYTTRPRKNKESRSETNTKIPSVSLSSRLDSVLEPEHQGKNRRAEQAAPLRPSETVQNSENWPSRTCDCCCCRFRYFLGLRIRRR